MERYNMFVDAKAEYSKDNVSGIDKMTQIHKEENHLSKW